MKSNPPKGFVRGFYRKIPVYFNESTSELYGRNWIYDKLVDLNVWFDFQVLGIEIPVLVEKNKKREE